MNYLTFVFLLFFSLPISAQKFFPYSPSQSKIPSKREFKKQMEENLEQDLQSISERNEIKSNISSIYTKRHEYLIEMALEKDEFIFNTPMNDYLSSIFSRLLSTNHIDSSRLQLFISRDLSPNASCLGDGSLMFNIGLMRRLSNESQVAFVLAHELAHYTQNHVNESIVQSVEKKYSKETQDKIKEISQLKYNRNQAGFELLQSVTYSSSKHSRIKESEADSIAVILLEKAGYNSNEALSALAILETIDDEKYKDSIIYHREFNRELYPFKNEWIVQENPLAVFFNKEIDDEVFAFDKDSIKTHPDCLQRIDLLAPEINNNGNTHFVEKIVHDNAVAQADFDYVLSAYHYKNYGFAIYQSLQLQKHYPDHPFLIGIIAACMGEMAIAMDDHELGKLLPQTSPHFGENYNDLLALLNTLTMKEMIEVGYNYARIYEENAHQNEALAYGLAITSKLKNKTLEKQNYKSIYYKHFTTGFFRNKVAKL